MWLARTLWGNEDGVEGGAESERCGTILPTPPRASDAPPLSGFVTKGVHALDGDDDGDGDGRPTIEIDLDAETIDVSSEAAVLAASEAACDELDRATDVGADPCEASEPTRFMQIPDVRSKT